MTTIIVVVVVALVFFVAVCVVSFMIWKRESEMRTDSIRAIEENLEKLACGLSPEKETPDIRTYAGAEPVDDIPCAENMPESRRTPPPHARIRSSDPFSWVRETGCGDTADTGSSETVITEEQPEQICERSVTEQAEHIIEPCIQDTADMNADIEYDISRTEDETETGPGLPDDPDTADDFSPVSRKHTGYDVGKSGKRYTASELETLIKE